MKQFFVALLSTAAMGAASSAFAANAAAEHSTNVELKKNGGYEATNSAQRTTAAGTKHEVKEKIDVDVDSKGMHKESTKTESSTDPKGLMNEKTSTSKATYKDKDNGGYKHTRTEKQTDAAGADVKTQTTTNVDVDAEKGTTATVKTEKTVDPKGLLNKTTTTTKAKAVNGKLVEEKKETN